MRFGVVYPQTEYPADPAAIKDYAQTAEGLGYRHILAYDHVLGAKPEHPDEWRGPYTYKHSFMEPFTLFSFMAAVTREIEFTTGILILPQRQTALVAKQAAVLDILSSGRLRLGVGLGWNPVEYEALKQSFQTRGRRIEEQIGLLKRLWTEPLLDFEGRWHKISAAGLNPMPLQQPIPIWFGGHHEKVLQRVARLGDGWMPNYRKAADVAPLLEKLDAFLEEAGRNREELGLEVRLQYGDGDPKVWRKTMDEWSALGATHASLNTMSYGLKTPKNHKRAIEFFSEEFGLTHS